MPGRENARPARRQFSHERSLFCSPLQEGNLLAVSGDTHATHAETRPIRELPGFSDRRTRVPIEMHLPKVAMVTKKRVGLRYRIEEPSIWHPEKIVYLFHFARAKYGGRRSALEIAA